MPPLHRILLTGATGFIGQHVHRAFLDQGHAVTAIIRPERRDVPIDPRAEVLRADLLDADSLRAAVARATAVVALAGAVRGARDSDFTATNTDAIRVLRDVLETTAPELPLLLMSSLAASRPGLSGYAASKRAGEDIITTSTLRWTALRPPAVYGPGDRELRPLLTWLARGVTIIPGDASQRIAFIHVADLTTACVAWLDHHTVLSRRIFTIDDGRADGYDWPAIEAAVQVRHRVRVVIPPPILRALGRMNVWWAERTGTAPMLSPGKVNELMNPRWVGSGDTEGNNAFTVATGWRPCWTLGAGVRQTLEN